MVCTVLCLASPVRMILKVIPVACINSLFLLVAEKSVLLHVCFTFCWFIHLLIKLLGYYQVLIIKSKTDVNTLVLFLSRHVFYFPFGGKKICRREKSPSLGKWMFHSLGGTLFSKVAIHFLCSCQKCSQNLLLTVFSF